MFSVQSALALKSGNRYETALPFPIPTKSTPNLHRCGLESADTRHTVRLCTRNEFRTGLARFWYASAIWSAPCYVRTQMGIPCPDCGFTTSFSHFVRGEFGQAFHANAAGLLSATFCALCIPWCWVSACTARYWGITSPEEVLYSFLCMLCITCLLN